MKHATILVLALATGGCDLTSQSESIQKEFDLEQPEAWMIRDGQKVDIGDEVVEIVGSDSCNTGFGDSYPCWIFSLKPGATTPVTLSNGIREVWTTQKAGEVRVQLVRPDGQLVSAVE
ncbi:hypothetical protein [Marinobacter sp. MBR-105]|jgi:hypothetical protein